MIFGNGGSAADAQHRRRVCEPLHDRRPPLPALALTTDTSVITSVEMTTISRKFSPSRFVLLGQPGDVAWGIAQVVILPM